MDNHSQDPLADRVGYVLRRTAAATMSELRSRLGEEDLSISDVGVLQLIRGRKDIISSEIGKMFEIKRPNMVRLVNRLETARLIRRVPLGGKKRAIVLTPVGREKLRRVDRITAQFESELIARVPAEHRKHLLPALKALWSFCRSEAGSYPLMPTFPSADSV